MKKLNFVIAFLLSVQFAWSQCPELIKIDTLPYSLVKKDPLKPDPCHARSIYEGKPKLVIGPKNAQNIREYEINMVTLTQINVNGPDNCITNTKVIQADTILKTTRYVKETIEETTGGFYMVRTELMRTLPATRPKNFMAIQLPAEHELGGYWVVGYDTEFKTLAEAKSAVKVIVGAFPEFCSSFAFYVPNNCKFKYKYK